MDNEHDDRYDATHGYCRKCSEVQPVIWNHFRRETYVGTDLVRTFTGMCAECEVCGFEVAQLGQSHTQARE